MKARYTNYTQTCREKTPYTRMDVAELLEKSIETIGDYERGETLIPPEDLLKLEVFFDQIGMALEYTRRTNPVVAKYMPETKGGLLENIVQISLVSKEFLDCSSDFLRAAVDGTLTNDSPEVVKKIHGIVVQMTTSTIGILPQILAGGVI